MILACGICTLGGCGMPGGPQNASHTDSRALFPALAINLKTLFTNTTPAEPDTAALDVYDAMAMGLKHHLAQTAQNTASTDPLARLSAGIRAAQNDPSLTAQQTAAEAAIQVIRDIRIAYARAAIAEQIGGELAATVQTLDAVPAGDLDAAEQADIATLRALSVDIADARAALAQMIGVPDTAQLKIDLTALDDIAILPAPADMTRLEVLALAQRPEAQVDNETAPTRHAQALQAFPAIRDILARSAAGQGSYSEEQWAAFSDHFARGLTRIFNLPLAVESKDNLARLEGLRQQAIAAAILAQVHIAQTRQNAARNALAPQEQTTPPQSRLAEVVARATRPLAMAAMHNAQDDMLAAAGFDVVPDNIESIPRGHLAEILQIRARTPPPMILAALDAPAATVTLASAPQPAAATTMPTLQPVSFSVPAQAATTRIPLPEKRASIKDIPMLRHDNPRFLDISRQEVHNLLDAPISEP